MSKVKDTFFSVELRRRQARQNKEHNKRQED
jgi:hypothetical protein